MDLRFLGNKVECDGMNVYERCPFCKGVYTFRIMGKSVCECIECGFFSFSEELEEAVRNNGLTYKQAVSQGDMPRGLINVGSYIKDATRVVRIPTGFSKIDETINGLAAGMVTVITGKRGEGKSTFVSQVTLNAINAGYRVCVYSGEMTTDMFQDWIFLQAAGSNNLRSEVNEVGSLVFHPTAEAERRIRPWLNRKLILSDNSIVKSNEQSVIFQRFAEAKHILGCQLFVIDNLMSARMDSTSERDFNRQQSGFVSEAVEFALKNRVHVILVAHPKKGDSGDINDDIAGTAEITNRAANVIRVEQADEKLKLAKGGIDSVLTISKNRENGVRCSMGFFFDRAARRYTLQGGTTLQHYDW